jgi:hypothetical protein
LFTYKELLQLGVRQRGYWLKQAEATRRHFIADVSYGVRMGMAEPANYQRAVDELELTRTTEESKTMEVENTWDMLLAIGGGKGV